MNGELKTPDHPGFPIIGLSGNYTFAKSAGNQSIELRSGSQIICLPGCKLRRANTFDSGSTGFIGGGTQSSPLQGARWIGGEIVGLTNDPSHPEPYDDYGGPYPPGQVMHLIGHDLRLEDITINGFGAAGKFEAGPAMALWGNRIRVINPRILHPYIPGDPDAEGNGGGIRVYGGTNFRCRGGEIHAGGDGALQFSAGDIGGRPGGAIVDGAFVGTRAFSEDGRLILVGPGQGDLRHLRFVAVTGETTGDGDGVRIGNGSEAGRVTEAVVLRDLAISRNPKVVGAGVTIDAEWDPAWTVDPALKLISDVRLENATITSPSATAMSVTSSIPLDREAPGGPVRAVSWLIGGVIDPDIIFQKPTLNIERLAGGLFESLRVAGGTGKPTIQVGNGDDSGRPAGCRDLGFVDVAVTAVRAGRSGARVDAGANVSWARGSVADADAAAPADAAFDCGPMAQGGSVAGADLARAATAFRIDKAATVRIGANHPGAGAENGRRGALQVGTASVPVMGGTATVASSGVVLSTTGGTLSTIAGGLDGTLLIARGLAGGGPVPVDEAGNLRLAGGMSIKPPSDTLTLIGRVGEWAELVRGKNT